MKLIILSIVIVALCVLLLCFNILLRRKEFPKFDVGSNEEMRKRGIRCFKDEDAALKKVLNHESCSDCRTTECREIHTV